MRLFHMLYAKLFGYFWKPCPICGRYFGSHEADPGVGLMLTKHSGELVCRNCGAAADRLNQRNFGIRKGPRPKRPAPKVSGR